MNAPLNVQNVQVINALNGAPEYVLIPVSVYNALRDAIEDELAGLEAMPQKGSELTPFKLDDYVDNPVTLARIKANVTQNQLAKRMGVTQAYISKVEGQQKVTLKLLAKVKSALEDRAG